MPVQRCVCHDKEDPDEFTTFSQGHQNHHTHTVGHRGDYYGNPKVVAAAGSSCSEHADRGAMVADFRCRFWVTMVATPPALLLSAMIQHWFGIAEGTVFPRRSLRPVRALYHRLWQLAIPDGLQLRAAQGPARNDDSDRVGELGRILLLGRRDVRLSRGRILLKAGDAHRDHAAWSLG